MCFFELCTPAYRQGDVLIAQIFDKCVCGLDATSGRGPQHTLCFVFSYFCVPAQPISPKESNLLDDSRGFGPCHCEPGPQLFQTAWISLDSLEQLRTWFKLMSWGEEVHLRFPEGLGSPPCMGIALAGLSTMLKLCENQNNPEESSVSIYI